MPSKKIEDLTTEELIDIDMPPLGPITQETKQQVIKNAYRFPVISNVRLAAGEFLTDKELEAERKADEYISKHLP